MGYKSLEQMRRDERIRVASLIERGKEDHLTPPEVFNHGDYAEVTIVEADKSSQATVKRRQSSTGLVRLYENGHLTEEQFVAAVKIGRIIERVQQDVGFRSASLEARVDNSGSGRSVLVEHIGQVRDEMAFNIWRNRIPVPRSMIVEMIRLERSLAATARVYKVTWIKARTRLIDAIDLWIDIRGQMEKQVDEDDLEAAHGKILTKKNEKSM